MSAYSRTEQGARRAGRGASVPSVAARPLSASASPLPSLARMPAPGRTQAGGGVHHPALRSGRAGQRPQPAGPSPPPRLRLLATYYLRRLPRYLSPCRSASRGRSAGALGSTSAAEQRSLSARRSGRQLRTRSAPGFPSSSLGAQPTGGSTLATCRVTTRRTEADRVSSVGSAVHETLTFWETKLRWSTTVRRVGTRHVARVEPPVG